MLHLSCRTVLHRPVSVGVGRAASSKRSAQLRRLRGVKTQSIRTAETQALASSAGDPAWQEQEAWGKSWHRRRYARFDCRLMKVPIARRKLWVGLSGARVSVPVGPQRGAD